MLHFECPSCKAKCESADSTAGMTIACPHCRKSVIVPQQSTATDSAGILFRRIILAAVGLALVAFVVMLVIPETPKGGGKSGGSGGPNPVVVMETSMGAVKIELFPDKAPITVENFLQYVDDKHYDGTIFHRVIKGFMVQGGGMLPGMKEKPTRASIKNESYNGLLNERGTVAMARTPAPDSASAQFFINVVNNSFLDRANAQDRVGYAVFGKVVEGMDVVDEIRFVPTREGDVPVTDVFIKSIRRAEPK